MTKQFTIANVRALLESQRESDEPDVILEILKANAGKKWTVHILRKLPGGEERWSYDHTAGMTNLKDRTYRNMQGGGGISLLLSYSSGPHTVDPAWVEEKNPAYFKGRRERNALREEMLAKEVWLDVMAKTLTQYAKAKEALDNAKDALDALTGYEKPFSPDQYDWERLCGAREGKS